MSQQPETAAFSGAPTDGVGAVAPGNGLSDETVIQRVLAGETAMFELIMRRYNQRLFRVIRSLAPDDAEAEDLLQETYLRAFKHLSQFQHKARFSTWLTRIAVHTATAGLRRWKRQPLYLSHAAMAQTPCQQPGGREPTTRLSDAELVALLTQAIDTLPHDLRAVFVLRKVEGLDTEQTAECLGLTTANVKVRLHRARAELRHRMEQRVGAQVGQVWAFGAERCDRVVTRVLRKLTNGRA